MDRLDQWEQGYCGEARIDFRLEKAVLVKSYFEIQRKILLFLELEFNLKIGKKTSKTTIKRTVTPTNTQGAPPVSNARAARNITLKK